MFWNKKDKAELEAELAATRAELAALPSNSPEVLEANLLVEDEKAKGTHHKAIDDMLVARELPGLAELGKITIAGLRASWKLNRKINKLEKQLAKLK